jgi:hypothetical protein
MYPEHPIVTATDTVQYSLQHLVDFLKLVVLLLVGRIMQAVTVLYCTVLYSTLPFVHMGVKKSER